jgi:hypothetical protein
MAICGWCKTKGLHNGRGVDGLEAHNLPNSRRPCEGPSTSPYASKITSRAPKKVA